VEKGRREKRGTGEKRRERRDLFLASQKWMAAHPLLFVL